MSETPSKAEKIAELQAALAHEQPLEAVRLAELLRDDDADVRTEAAALIWEFPEEPELVEDGLRLAREDASTAVRQKALTSLGRIVYEGMVAGADLPDYAPDTELGDPAKELFQQVRAALVDAAKDEKRPAEERRAAVESLGFLGNDADVAPLIEALWKNGDDESRTAALTAMGRSGTSRFAGLIDDALALAGDVRLQAIWAAGEVESRSSEGRLIALARGTGSSREDRLAAIDALGRLGGENATQALLELNEGDADPEVREAAGTGLEEIALLDPDGGNFADDDDAS